MIGFVFKLLLLFLILYVVAYVYKAVKKVTRTINNPFGQSETCPACHRKIQVSGEEMECPHCGTKLARNKDGKLLIRVN